MNHIGADPRYEKEYLQKMQHQTHYQEQRFPQHQMNNSAPQKFVREVNNYRPTFPSQDRYPAQSFSSIGIHGALPNLHSISPVYHRELPAQQDAGYHTVHQQARYIAEDRSFGRPIYDREIPYPSVHGQHSPDNAHGFISAVSHGKRVIHNNSVPSIVSPQGSPRQTLMAGTGGSNAQGRAINKMLLEIVRDRGIDPQRLHMCLETFLDRMDCVNLATLLFHTGKKRFLLAPMHVKMIADRMKFLNEELRAREASNALYGLKCLSSEIPEVRELVLALANKISLSSSAFVAQAVGNALYGLQMMTSEYEEVRFLLLVLSGKVSKCSDLLEAQNVGNALYGLRGMTSDCKEVRTIISALTLKVASAKEDLNGQAVGNSLYGLQNMSSKEYEVRNLLTVLAAKVIQTWEELKAQEVGNALYGLKRMSSDVSEVRSLIAALVPKIASSPELLDAQAIGNSFYGLQNMKSDNPEILALLEVLAGKVAISNPELDGQAMGNSLYGLQGMSSEYPEVRSAISALTIKIQSSSLEMNAQELGNALYGLQNMTSDHKEVRLLLLALAHKISLSKHDLTSQEVGNSLFGLQGMSSEHVETRIVLEQLAMKIEQSQCALDPQGVSNTIFGLQRMSSECHEVRRLIQVVSRKIQHCWKVLSPHHLADACFGLQNLSSEHPEVRMLLKGFVSKVSTCHEELSAKQLSSSIFGMQNLNANHSEVRAFAAVLAEKVSTSGDLWSPQHIALAIFGLQGFNSDHEETTMLLGTINMKGASVSLHELDPIMLGNLLYGIQRMSSSNFEVAQLLTMLTPALKLLHAQPERFTPLVCANIIFGVQRCSCTLEPVRLILELVLTNVQAYTDFLRKRSPRKATAVELFQEYISLFQAACLSLSVMPDMQMGGDLHIRCLRAISEMEHTIADLVEFYSPRSLTTAEINLFKEVQDLVVTSEVLKVKRSSLVAGFDFAVSLESVGSPIRAGETVLVVEVIGSSYSYPSKELFCHLRRQYLSQAKQISVKIVSAQSFALPNQPGLQQHSDILSAIRSVMEEQEVLDAIGGSKDLDLVMSNLAFDFTHSSSDESEYYDDELRLNDQSDLPRRSYHRNPGGLSMGWLGERPVLNNVQHAAASQQWRFVASAARPAAALTPLSEGRNVALSPMQIRPLLEQRGMIPAALDLRERLAFSSSAHFGQIGSSDSTLLLDGRHFGGDHEGIEIAPSGDISLSGKTIESSLSRGTSSNHAAMLQSASSVSHSFFQNFSNTTQSLDGVFGNASELVLLNPALEIDAPSRSMFIAPPAGAHRRESHNSTTSSDSGDMHSWNPSAAHSMLQRRGANEDEIALLEAQLEMAKLEAKIHSIKARQQSRESASPSGLQDILSPSKYLHSGLFL
jgi:hypothetical protein